MPIIKSLDPAVFVYVVAKRDETSWPSARDITWSARALVSFLRRHFKCLTHNALTRDMWCVTKPKDVCLGGFSNWTWRKRCSVLIKEKTTNGTSSICQYLNSFSQDYNYGGKIRSCPKLNTPRGKLISTSDNILIRTDFFYFLARKPRTRGSRGTSKNMVMRFMISLTGVWISCLMRKSENKVGITLGT